MRRAWIAALAILFFTGVTPGQDRFVVGRKLVSFEEAWDAQPDVAARKRTLPPLKRAMAQFFGGKFGDAARSLDEARHALKSDTPPSDAIRWVDSLAVVATRRLNEPGPVEARISRIYDPGLDAPEAVEVSLFLDGADGVSHELISADARNIPKLLIFPGKKIPEGDHTLRAVFRVNGQEVTATTQTISVAKDAKSRLERLRSLANELTKRERPTVESLTLLAHVQRLVRLADGVGFETNIPAERQLREAEALAKLSDGESYFDGQRPGQYWLNVPVRDGKNASIRIDVPPEVKAGNPVPLVVALHGAGGTENLFFDAYGHGEVVRQARKRGWIVVATRTEGFFAAPPVTDVVDELARRYPVDKSKVFVVGHSMGAGQAVGLARAFPDRWAGVACLGGGAAIPISQPLKKVPFYVGVGTEDFLAGGCRGLVKALKDGGVETVKANEFPDIEHIVIVQVALPEVFDWFEKLPGRK